MLITLRRTLLAATGVATFAAPMPAVAQVDPDIALDTLRECGKIDDPAARFACYDANIRHVDAAVEPPAPPQGEAPQPGSAPVVSVGAASSAEAPARARQRLAAPADALAAGTPIVAAVAERGPGAYLVTLEDGAQWEFAEDMGLGYRAPRRGSTVEIKRGTLGSHRMRFDGQQPVRIRRIR